VSTPSEVAGRYRLDGRLGAGGMSTVFRAMDNVLERPVAIKLLAEHLAEDEAFVARFRREALAAARLQHPNVVQVYDSGRDPGSGRHYIVMELVDGPSCADLLRDCGTLEIDTAVRIVRDACHGLDYAHRAGVVHRDVKPGNLLIANESDTTKLADFGIAKAAEQSRITQVGSVLGTAAYLSPEQARGEEAGPPSDIYSLGVCAYQFLTGRLPHEYGSLTELALKQQNDPIDPVAAGRPDVPPALDRAITLCLARQPEARYATAIELAEALDAGLRDEATDATHRLESTTQSLQSDPGLTQAMPATGATQVVASPRPAPPLSPPTPYGGEPATSASAPAAAATTTGTRNRRARALAIGLVLLLAAVAVYIVLSATGGSAGPPLQPVAEDDVPAQVDGLRRLIEENRAGSP